MTKHRPKDDKLAESPTAKGRAKVAAGVGAGASGTAGVFFLISHFLDEDSPWNEIPKRIQSWLESQNEVFSIVAVIIGVIGCIILALVCVLCRQMSNGVTGKGYVKLFEKKVFEVGMEFPVKTDNKNNEMRDAVKEQFGVISSKRKDS